MLHWAIAIVGCFLAERLVSRVAPRLMTAEGPDEARNKRPQRLLRNVLISVVDHGVVGALVMMPFFLYACRHPFPFAPHFQSGVGSFIKDFLALDFVFWALHVADHKVPLMWRFHAVHHMDEACDPLTADRVHFMDRLFFIPGQMLTIMVLGISARNLILYASIAGVFSILHHTRLRLPKPLNRFAAYFLALPSFHRTHHIAVLPYTDSNYGLILSVWDHVFGTTSVDSPPAHLKYGVDTAPEQGLVELMVGPFRGPRTDLGRLPPGFREAYLHAIQAREAAGARP